MGKKRKVIGLHISHYIMFFFFFGVSPPKLVFLLNPSLCTRLSDREKTTILIYNAQPCKNFTFFVIRSSEISPFRSFFLHHHSGSDNPLQHNTHSGNNLLCPINIKGQNKQHYAHRSSVFSSFSFPPFPLKS